MFISLVTKMSELTASVRNVHNTFVYNVFRMCYVYSGYLLRYFIYSRIILKERLKYKTSKIHVMISGLVNAFTYL
jgi:hypothetical protein